MLLAWLLVFGLGGLAVWGYIEAVQDSPAIVGSVGAAVLGVFGVLWQQRASEQARLREARRERMTPIYDGLLRLVLDRMGSAGDRSNGEEGTEGQVREDDEADGEGDGDQETEAFMRDLRGRQLFLGASSEMIRAFNMWQATTNAANVEKDEAAAVLAWEDFLLAIRKDLGHQDSGLPPRELLRVLIPDIDEHLPPHRVQ
jgi:hypothetical protein